MWKYIILGVIGSVILGPFGTFIGVGIAFWLGRQAQQEANESHQADNQIVTIQTLTPIIDLLCIYALKHDDRWVSDKVKFIKNKFVNEDSSQSDLIYLRDRIKLQNRPSLNQTVYDYLALEPSLENKQLILESVLYLLVFTCDDPDRVRQESVSLGECIGLSQTYCVREADRVWDVYHAQYQDSQQQINDDIAQSASVLGVSVDASVEEIQKAWRIKMKDFHPDRNVNVTESVRQLIEEQARTINKARDDLMAYKNNVA